LAKASDLSGADVDTTWIEVEEHELEKEQNCTLVIASNILLHRELLQTAASALADGACILTREKPETRSTISSGFRLESVFEKTIKDEKLLLLRKVMAPLTVLINNWKQEVHYGDHKSLPYFPILSQSSHHTPTLFLSILILSSHLFLSLQSGLFSSDFLNEFFHAFFISLCMLYASTISFSMI
jgi:hypothetical protein